MVVESQQEPLLERTAMKKTILALGCTATLFGAGCIGPNNAYNAVQNWNAQLTETRIVNELLFLLGWIIPAYPLIWTGDLLIFNSIEFWGGENPIPRPEPFAHPE